MKAIDTISLALPPSSSTPATTTIVCTISSDGKIHIYDLASLDDPPGEQRQRLEPAAVYDTKGTRLTCVTLSDGDVAEIRKGKRKREDRGKADKDESDQEEEE